MNFEKKELKKNKTEAKSKHPHFMKKLALGTVFLSMMSCSVEEVPDNTEMLAEFNLTNSFSVDNANINPDKAIEIQSNIIDFLDEYNNPQDFSKLTDSRIIIECSSDERPTSSWGERGNEALTEERIYKLDSLVHATLDRFDYNDSIPSEDVMNFQTKNFVKTTPAGSWGAGFLPIAQMTNPETGTLFSEEEIKNLSSNQKDSLYDNARYSRVRFEIPGEDEKELQYLKLGEIMNGYGQTTLMLDASGSMGDDYALFSEKITQQLELNSEKYEDTKASVVPFESSAYMHEAENVSFKDLPEKLKQIRERGGDELILKSVSQQVNALSETPSRQAVIALSDEGIQDYSLNALLDISKKADQKNADVYLGLLEEESETGLISFFNIDALVYDLNSFSRKILEKYPEAFLEDQLVEQNIKWIMENMNQVQGIHIKKDGSFNFELTPEAIMSMQKNLVANRDRIVHENFAELKKQVQENPEQESVLTQKYLEKQQAVLDYITDMDFELNTMLPEAYQNL